ncbi:MAG: ThiF family adenylyltransferase [Cyanobacteria bacterium SBLK]|nr:ThiF family adenylyltransferase [Cyanobacteria bacterium SBLK]
MSPKLINHSPDLKRLREEGYSVEIRGGLLLLNEIPYVNAQKQVKTGILISELDLAGNVTRKPKSHIAYFNGECPCKADGLPIHQILNRSVNQDLGNGIMAKHLLSNKPEKGYTDYYHKMSTYANIISAQARVLKPGISARIFPVPHEEEESVFAYIDTASSRAGIGMLVERLASEKIGIIGLGGTGSYVLDFVAKTPVQDIHLFDRDKFLQHNAFRAPGAPSIDELRNYSSKVDYLKSIYSKMHCNIHSHAVAIDANNLNLLEGLTFVFVCIDSGLVKHQIFQKLEELDVPFIDVGMGLELVDGSLGGILRVTTSTPDKREHVYGRISFEAGGDDNLYATNIQVVELNAKNAASAVIKWKQIRGFYRDLEKEHHCTYTTDGNTITNLDLV